ncbi:hypothetical protein [Nocardia sp.]|nr:hypothetical protein [Nocardia sp.]
MTETKSWLAQMYEDAGYHNADTTRRHLKTFTEAGINLNQVSRAANVPSAIVYRIARGYSKVIRPDWAEALADLTIEKVRQHKKPAQPISVNWNARRFEQTGYHDAAATRAILNTLADGGCTMYRLSKITGIHDTWLGDIKRGKAKFVHPDDAKTIAAIDVEDLLDLIAGENYVDPVMLERILRGQHRGTITTAERKAVLNYAVRHNWTRSDLAPVLGVSRETADRALVRRRAALRKQAAA